MKFSRGAPEETQYHERETNWFDRWFVSEHERERGFNRHMFEDDIVNIFRHSSNRSGGEIEIESNNDALTERLLSNVQTRYDQYGQSETIVALVEEILQALVWFDRAVYSLHENDEQQSTSIVSASSGTFIRFAGLTFQYFPHRREHHWENGNIVLDNELRLLAASRTLYFYWPRSIRRRIDSQNKVLRALDKDHGETTLKFLPQVTHDNPNPRNYFDYKLWSNTQDYALFKATQATGWSGRKFRFEKKSDFFDCHRLLRFRRLQLELRDQILVQLSDQLSRAGKRYWKNYTVTFSASNAAPSVLRLDELEVQLTQEKVGFSEVMDYCFKS